jgi:hypothetical protein
VGYLFGISASGFGLGIMDGRDRDGGGLTRGLGRIIVDGGIAMAGRVMIIELVELPSPAVFVEPSHSVLFYMSCV